MFLRFFFSFFFIDSGVNLIQDPPNKHFGKLLDASSVLAQDEGSQLGPHCDCEFGSSFLWGMPSCRLLCKVNYLLCCCCCCCAAFTSPFALFSPGLPSLLLLLLFFFLYQQSWVIQSDGVFAFRIAGREVQYQNDYHMPLSD